MVDEFVPFPQEQGYQPVAGLGGFLPLEYRPIPYANALQPRLAIPPALKETANLLFAGAQIPGEAARGELGQSPEELMGPALKTAEAMMTGGLTGSSLAGVPENSLGAMMGYHGTPHRFEPVEHNPFGEFKNEAIGSGEGAAVYGHGHYVAGAKEVAEQYQKNLSGMTIEHGGKTFTRDQAVYNLPPGPMRTGLTAAFDTGGDVDRALSNLKQQANIYRGPHFADESMAKRHEDAANWLESNKNDVKGETAGSLYHVEIKPEEHELLDWHKPMSEQTSSVRNKIIKILPEHLKPGVESSSGYRFADQTGKDIYQSLAIQTPGKMYDDQAVSAALHEAGIPGIKYLDQFSRDVPAGQPKTSNYVIFHPSNLKIRGRNGEMLQLQELSSEEAGGRINRALQNIHASEAAELGYGRRDTTAISPAQQQIDQMMRQHTVEAVDYDPFAVAKFVKEGGT